MVYPERSAEPELLGVWGWEEREGEVKKERKKEGFIFLKVQISRNWKL